MDAQTAGIKLAATVDDTLVHATSTAQAVTETMQTFWGAFSAELQRRRAARSGPMAPVVVTNPKLM